MTFHITFIIKSDNLIKPTKKEKSMKVLEKEKNPKEKKIITAITMEGSLRNEFYILCKSLGLNLSSGIRLLIRRELEEHKKIPKIENIE